MNAQKKPYIPQKIEIHPNGSQAYKRFMELLAEQENTDISRHDNAAAASTSSVKEV